eukprot:447982-Amorphochlora_amoeboformis.AAC.3
MAVWLDAFHDPVANVDAYSECLGLADLDGCMFRFMKLYSFMYKSARKERGTRDSSSVSLIKR